MIVEPKCYTRKCKHFIGVKGKDETKQFVACKAYPNGIPAVIAYGDNLHLEAYPADQGIRFEKDVDSGR